MIAYSHTTIEWAQPDVWAHPRDYRDAQDGRENVQPLDDPLSEAIGHAASRKAVLLCASIHLVEESDVEQIDVTVTIDDTTSER